MRPFRNKLYSAYDVLLIHANMAWSTLRTRVSCVLKGCKLGKGFSSSGKIRIKARTTGDIIIGNHVRLLAGCRSNCAPPFPLRPPVRNLHLHFA